jgi:diguanylate cyclase (GGDEF)-like protein
LLIDHTDATQAAQVAERLRANIYQLKRGSSQEPASASFGISIFCGGNEKLSDLLSSADRMLYVAKESGRNRVVVDQQSLPLTV